MYTPPERPQVTERPTLTRSVRRKARKAHALAHLATNRIAYGLAVDNTQLVRRKRRQPHAHLSQTSALEMVVYLER